ncbi:phage shock protein B [Paraglaciecola aquimarina]|uniref:Phage shock protein B n=1 Tax=Paraglaciecola algarum TaxID=3050085 RepID=A0ABS9DAW3_9ALTE|nr:phage shock protein B [Paraglaciecola sp. G1-23]MCF2949986.1 phage shock protein B [Paraglaciecola sp. G1-23]
MNMTAIAIVAIACWAVVELVNGPKNRKKSKSSQEPDQATLDLQQQVEAMRERIETLEKIVTDEKYDLHRQFDDLKKDKVA